MRYIRQGSHWNPRCVALRSASGSPQEHAALVHVSRRGRIRIYESHESHSNRIDGDRRPVPRDPLGATRRGALAGRTVARRSGGRQPVAAHSTALHGSRRRAGSGRLFAGRPAPAHAPPLALAMLCYAMLCHAMRYAMLCCAMLCYAMLCYAVLCCAVLCYARTAARRPRCDVGAQGLQVVRVHQPQGPKRRVRPRPTRTLRLASLLPAPICSSRARSSLHAHRRRHERAPTRAAPPCTPLPPEGTRSAPACPPAPSPPTIYAMLCDAAHDTARHRVTSLRGFSGSARGRRQWV